MLDHTKKKSLRRSVEISIELNDVERDFTCNDFFATVPDQKTLTKKNRLKQNEPEERD